MGSLLSVMLVAIKTNMFEECNNQASLYPAPACSFPHAIPAMPKTWTPQYTPRRTAAPESHNNLSGLFEFFDLGVFVFMEL